MAGSNGTFTDTLKNTVSEKVTSTVSQLGGNGKSSDRTIFGVKLNPEDFEKVSKIVTDAATAIGPFLAKSKEKTAEAAHNAPGADRFEEQFTAAIEAIDKRQADARDRVKSGASSAKEAAAAAALSAREATAHAAASAKDATANMAASAREASNSAKDATSHAKESAKSATANAAAETADASKNFLAMLFWLGAAAAAIYFLILNKERREQVAGYARSGASVAREIVTEVRGEDGQFSK